LRAGSSVCILSEALFIVWAPLIMKDNWAKWEAYTAQNLQQIRISFFSEFSAWAAQDELYNLNVSLPNPQDLLACAGAISLAQSSILWSI
jgi:hypothetical protein